MLGIVLISTSHGFRLFALQQIDNKSPYIYDIEMDVNVMVIRIMSYIVAECEYERMIDQSCRGIDTSMSYDNYYQHMYENRLKIWV